MNDVAPNRPTRRENPDPVEAAGKIPKWFLVFAFATVAGGAGYLYVQVPKGSAGFAGDSRTVQPAPAEVSGEALFGVQCAACHQANGQGVAGVFPPLVGSEWVTRDPETPVRILLWGINGEIVVGGERYEGNMPAFGHLTDEEIAKLVSYVRTSWENEASEVDAALVGEVRAATDGRSGPWSGGAELAALRPDGGAPAGEAEGALGGTDVVDDAAEPGAEPDPPEAGTSEAGASEAATIEPTGSGADGPARDEPPTVEE